MSDYSYQDIMRMQEEAKARVMEMRRRSRFVAERFDPPLRVSSPPEREEPTSGELPPEQHARAISLPVEFPSPEKRQVASPQTEPPEKTAEKPPRQKERRGEERQSAARGQSLPFALRNVFGEMSREETEKMFLLSLFLLLSQENGDEGLLLSLMYLLT